MNLGRTFLLAATLLTGCASGRYSLGATTAVGDVSAVEVLGRRPRIVVENEGPGLLRLDFEGPDGSRDDSVTVGVGVTARTLRGPVRVRLEPAGNEPIVWRLVATDCRGLRADVLVEHESGALGER